MKDKILINEKIIEKFELDYYINSKNYGVSSALSALETTNEIQKSYFMKEETNDIGENLLNLYALLQSLFVSIDSLYSLAYSLTKSKAFININKNDDLRKLKYIRNDVVGHPANRTYSSNDLAYCILDNESVKKYSFSYNIYYSDNVESVTIDLNSIVNSYYIECNNLLNEIYIIAKENKSSSKLTKKAFNVLDSYINNKDYVKELKELKELYLKSYTNAKSDQHRLIMRIEHIERMLNYKTLEQDIMDLIKYSIGLELIKIYQNISGKKYSLTVHKRAPILVSSLYRFLNKNKECIDYKDCICDINNPLFMFGLNYIIDVAKKKNVTNVIKYLNIVKYLYDNKEDELLYSFTLPIREYKKK